MTKRRILSLAGAVLTTALVGGQVAFAHNEGLPAAPLETKNFEHVFNLPNAVGNSMAFFERKNADGSLARYLVVATMGNAFDIVEITDPTHPKTVGRYLLDGPPQGGQAAVQNSSLGLNYHPWVDVNPRRNIVAISVEEPAVTVRSGLTRTVTLVDIADLANPRFLSNVTLPNTPNGPHTIRMIGDNHIYTSLDTYIIDYTDPRNPKSNLAPSWLQGHEFYEDPNRPGITYMGVAAVGGGFKILNTTNPANPGVIVHRTDGAIENSHEVYPAPDSSYVGVADFRKGQADLRCPGGGIHFWDISGKYVPGASLTTPKKMGVYLAPFAGLGTPTVANVTPPNYASCTMHSWHMQGERELALGGLYTGGTFVFDPSRATQTGGPYTEYDGDAGKTTWGNTVANNRDALDFVNASQWLPFDLSNPDHEKLIYVNGWERGLDVYRYTQTLPKKMSRLQVSGSAPGGTVSGKLERYAVLTSTGWKNTPLAFRTVLITTGGQTVSANTGADGSFSATLSLAPGSNQVTVTWPGDGTFRGESVTTSVSV